MVGRQFQQGFQMLLRQLGCTVVIHKNHGQPNQTTTEVRGLKNNEKNRPNEVMFQFPERIDIEVGDVLQQKAANDLWVVTETEDNVSGDVLVNFEAKVEKMGARPRSRAAGNVVIHGPNYGAVQLNSPYATQNVSTTVVAIAEPIARLRELLEGAEIDELDKEDAEQALDRIEQLAKKVPTPTVVSRIKDRLAVVNGAFSVAKNTAELAAPYVETITKAFGIS